VCDVGGEVGMLSRRPGDQPLVPLPLLGGIGSSPRIARSALMYSLDDDSAGMMITPSVGIPPSCQHELRHFSPSIH
jgi:hypothetical protein